MGAYTSCFDKRAEDPENMFAELRLHDQSGSDEISFDFKGDAF